jgi:hypothetical protein
MWPTRNKCWERVIGFSSKCQCEAIPACQQVAFNSRIGGDSHISVMMTRSNSFAGRRRMARFCQAINVRSANAAAQSAALAAWKRKPRNNHHRSRAPARGSRISGCPMRIRGPSRILPDKVKPTGASTMIVEPYWNHPISSPQVRETLSGMIREPSRRSSVMVSRKFSRMPATRIAATGTSVMA